MARKYSPSMMFAPTGQLVPSMFPGREDAAITDALQSYLDDGYVKADGATDEDEAAIAWAYHRAFGARALEMASMPASISVANEATTTRTDGQRAHFENLAERWEGTFYGYFPDAEASGDIFPPSGFSSNVYRF